MRTIVLLSALALASSVASAQSQYLVHSSGNVLGANTDNRAVLLAPNNTKAKALRFAKQGDGSYIIALDGTQTLYLSLGTANGWSTYFVTDSTDARAHYTIEQSGSYTLLKNKQTNGYLGSDDNTAGAYVYSDKSGTDTKHKWHLSDTPNYEMKVDTVSYAIGVEADRQLVEGWGVSLCWWANMCGKWSDAKIDKLIDWMVSPTGLNWNIFRYNIGGGDDPEWKNCTPHHMGGGKGLRAEMEGFQDERGGEFHWERDAAQRKIMLKIKEKRPDAIFEAFSNSCPWWMTYSGCCSGSEGGGSDNLRPEYYEDFANYLVEVCKHYKDEYGIEFKTLEPFNESVTGFWYRSGVQEGCHFDFASQSKFIKVLAPILQKSGLNTMISAADETNVGLGVGGLKQYLNDGVMPLLGQLNTHTYSGSNRDRSQFGSIARAEGKLLWMSETGSGGSGIGGNLSMAQRLIDDMRYIAPDAWIDWQYMEEANDQWCFVRGSFANQTFDKVKNYYVRQHFSRFIKKGYTVVESLNDHSLSAVSPERDSLIIVLVNSDAPTIHNITLPMATIGGTMTAWRTSETESLKVVKDYKQIDDSTLQVTLPELSITTIIVPIKTEESSTPLIADGDTYMIIPQTNVNAAVEVSGSSLKLAEANVNSDAQKLVLRQVEEGVYRLQNMVKGNYVTASSSYTMALTPLSTSNNQKFQLVPVDGIHYRITVNNDRNLRSWDLDGQNLTPGTKVGNYAYGNSASADTRNWFLMKVGSSSPEADVINSPSMEILGIRRVYSITGTLRQQLEPGLNIIKNSDGSVTKIHK